MKYKVKTKPTRLLHRMVRYFMLYLASLLFVEMSFGCILFNFYRYLLQDMSTVDRNYAGTGFALFYVGIIVGLVGLVAAIPVVPIANKLYLRLRSELSVVHPKEIADT